MEKRRMNEDKLMSIYHQLSNQKKAQSLSVFHQMLSAFAIRSGVVMVLSFAVVGDVEGQFAFSVNFQQLFDVSPLNLRGFKVKFPLQLEALFRHKSVALVCVEGFDLLQKLQFSFCEEFVTDE
jgi:hypothetical protein